MNKWTDIYKPVVVLAVICVLVGLALSGVNAMTVNAIAANEEEERTRSYYQALPEADSFTEIVPCPEGADAAFSADNGAGWVISAAARGYGGNVMVVTAFSDSGEVLNVVVDSSTETPGMGSKVSEEAFIGNFTGKSAETLSLEEIDAVTGATISSKAALNAFNRTVEAYHEAKGGE